jgi:hypothetical protein
VERIKEGSASFCEQKEAKKLCYAGPWAATAPTPMPSGAIPTVLRTAGTFSPSAQRKRSFCAAFLQKNGFFLLLC